MPPSTPDTLGSDPRCLKKKAELDVLAEGLKAANIPMIHWDEADGPTECIFVQNQDFKAYLWEAFMPTAAYADWTTFAPHDTYHSITWKVVDLDRTAEHLKSQGVGIRSRTADTLVTDPETSIGVPWGFTTRLVPGDPRV